MLGNIILDFVRGSTKIFVTLGASLLAHIIQQCLVPDNSEFKACYIWLILVANVWNILNLSVGQEKE